MRQPEAFFGFNPHAFLEIHPQNHRMIEWFGLEGTLKIIWWTLKIIYEEKKSTPFEGKTSVLIRKSLLTHL